MLDETHSSITIGRAEDNDIVIKGNLISRTTRSLTGGSVNASVPLSVTYSRRVVTKFAVKVKHLATNVAEGSELPRLPEAEQRYLSHEQLHRVAVACGRHRTPHG